jgi:hypothetical protein
MNHDENCLCGKCRPGFGNPNDQELQAYQEEQTPADVDINRGLPYIEVYVIATVMENGLEASNLCGTLAEAETTVLQLRHLHEVGYFRPEIKGFEVKIVDVTDFLQRALAETV